MRYFDKVRRLSLAVSLFAATLGTAHATLPGTNGVIVYETDQGAIMKVAPDGGIPQKIGAGSHPAVSPDGMKVAFAINMINGVMVGQLWVMNIDGTNLRKVGESRHEGGNPPFAYNPPIDGIAWSPDGTQIAYADQSPNYFQVLVCNVSRGCPNPIDWYKPAGIWRIENNGWWLRLNWSTAGIIGSTNYENRLIDPTGNVDAVSYPYLGWASWLPGSKVLSGSSALGNCASTMNVDGTGPKQLGSSCMPSSWNTVSPDGSSFASVSTGRVLSTQSLSGQNSKTLATGAVSADWSRAPAPMVAINMASDVSNTWPAPPTLLGGDAYYISQVAVTVMPVSSFPAYNRKQAVGTSNDGTVYYRQLASTASGNTWSAWTVVPGIGGTASGFKAKHVSIAGAYDGSAQVVAIGLDDNVYHAMRYANGTWSGFNPLGFTGSNGKARTAAIAISGSTATSPGVAQVIANDFDNGTVFHRVRYADSWTPWAQQSTTLVNTGSLAITADYGGRAFILATQPENGLLRTVRYADGTWDAWTPMQRPGSATGTPIDISLAADTTYIDAQSVYVGIVDANRDVWFQTINNPLDKSSWASPASPATRLLSHVSSVSLNFSNTDFDMTVTQPGIQAQLLK